MISIFLFYRIIHGRVYKERYCYDKSSVCLSVCLKARPSVTLMYRGRNDCVSSKVINE